MRKIDRRFEDDGVFDEYGVLRPGATARISMSMRDSVDRPLTHDELAIRLIEQDAQRRRHLHVDAADPAPFALNRPGFRRLVAADGDREQQAAIATAKQRVADAHAEYIHDLENAWRTPPASSIGAHEHASPVEGGLCSTSGGAPGTYQWDEDSGEMVCVADPRVNGSTDGRTLGQLLKDRAAIMTPLYEQIERELSEAWRTK